ncbi:fibronectin type III domain-containing protein [Desulfogranum mediterraneum]|uniref:hypothetical protein n=1 Tax=Desulfogranum mediterraneum TaxID=160661 RepID=UPI00041359B1|nr:hypothetical protein [Desulfogranum mediterraneum]
MAITKNHSLTGSAKKIVFSMLFYLSLTGIALSQTATFSWLPNTEKALAGYRIHYGTSSRNYTSSIDIGKPQAVNGRIYGTIENLTVGNKLYFAATAYDDQGASSGFSQEAVWNPTDTTTPPPDAESATFSWLPNTETSLAGYRIHYGTSSRAYTTTLDIGKPQAVNGRIYATVNNLTPGDTLYFAATAYDDQGTGSSFSQEAIWNPTDTKTPPPDAAGSATFSWLPNTETNLAGYRIHYGTSSRAYTTTLDIGKPQAVNGRIYATVNNLAPGDTLYFAATAYDDQGASSSFSEEVAWQPPESTTPPPEILNIASSN